MSRVQRIAIVAGVLVAAGAIPFVVDVVDSPSVSLASEEGGASGVAGPRHEPRRGADHGRDGRGRSDRGRDDRGRDGRDDGGREDRGRDDRAGDDISGPCDEAEHAADPECTGIATSPDDDRVVQGGEDISGPCDEAEHAGDPECTGVQTGVDDGFGHRGRGGDDDGGDNSGHR